MILVIPIFFVLGSLVMLSYMTGVYLMKTFPDNYDVDGIWAGLEYKNKCLLYMWYLGEILACVGFLCLTSFLWEDTPGQEVFIIFYTLFLVSACFWMPLVIQGDRFYSLTIFVLFLTSLSTIVLLIESFRFWGPKSYKPWLLIPLTLHCTCFDMMYWSWTWVPADLKTKSKNIIPNIDSRSLFVVAEEDDEDGTIYSDKQSILGLPLKYNYC
jgi:hypothetical protein